MSVKFTDYIDNLKDGDRLSGVFHICQHCGEEFVASADAKYCGHTCRMAAFRARGKEGAK